MGIDYIIRNPHVPIQWIIDRYIDTDEPELWGNISKHATVTVELLDSVDEELIDWEKLSSNIRIDRDVLEKYIDQLDIHTLSYNDAVPHDFIISHYSAGWDSEGLNIKKYPGAPPKVRIPIIKKSISKQQYQRITSIIAEAKNILNNARIVEE